MKHYDLEARKVKEQIFKIIAYRFRYKEYDKTYGESRIIFQGKQIRLDRNPRVGVCNLCRAVLGSDCKMTAMHHEFYDPNRPLANTTELCQSCHNKRTWELGQIKTTRPIKLK